MAELKNILQRIENIFKSVDLKYIIVGGVTIIHYGHVRTTTDIDIILENKPSEFGKFINILKKNDFDVMEDQFFQGIKEGTNITIFDNKSYFRLDLKIANNNRENILLDKAIMKELFDSNLLIPSLEDVLVGKILYIGNIEDIPYSELLEYQDIIDFLTLFHANEESINLKYLEEEIRNIGLELTFNKLLSIKL
ncbi:MAG: hypothetical protein KGD57_00990 [Candidatus Lokiarchaeota archaeon]|nr:hypothetical protein [Candidatus Lokiarchaeota archaeon]